MEAAQYIMMGFSNAITPLNLFACFLGVLAGTLVGVLPGLGPSAGIAILIPVTYKLGPTPALIMMAGLYYGAMYGGSTTSILVNLPGEAASVMTCLDGYQMARKGRAGAALGMAAISSFIAGTLGVVGLMLLAPPLADFAVSFGSAEYFALTILGMSVLTGITGDSVIKGLISAAIGLLLATVGLDTVGQGARFTFGYWALMDGISFISVAVGLFAVGEVLASVEESQEVSLYKAKLSGLLPNLQDFLACRWTFVRAFLIGFFMGVVPGHGATISAFLAYGIEKRVSKHPELFGTGVIEGVAAPEGANNAASAGAMVPLLTLGIPGSGATAVMLGALMIHGLRPGPLLFQNNPEFVWTVIASMYIGNVMLLVLNLPLVPMWAQLLRIPYRVLIPLVLAISFIGVYAVDNSVFEVWVTIVFGVVGYLARKFGYPCAPMVMGLVLGPVMEGALRQALALSHGDITVFVTRPLSAVLLVIAMLSLFSPLLRTAWDRATGKSEAALGQSES